MLGAKKHHIENYLDFKRRAEEEIDRAISEISAEELVEFAKKNGVKVEEGVPSKMDREYTYKQNNVTVYDIEGIKQEILTLLSDNKIPTWEAKLLLTDLVEEMDYVTVVTLKE